MAVVGLLEHLCSLMDTQPSEVIPLFFEFRIEFLPDGWKKMENSFLPRKIWKKWTKWNVTDIKNKINVLLFGFNVLVP